MSDSNKAVVKKFLDSFNGNGWPDLDELVSLFSDDAVCYVVYPSTPPVTGKKALREELERQAKDSENPRCDIRVIASEGRYVLVEREDTFITMGKPLAVNICSTFEVNDEGLICAWREYLDSADPAKKLGLNAAELDKLLQ